jgi:hypothetical protein
MKELYKVTLGVLVRLTLLLGLVFVLLALFHGIKVLIP